MKLYIYIYFFFFSGYLYCIVQYTIYSGNLAKHLLGQSSSSFAKMSAVAVLPGRNCQLRLPQGKYHPFPKRPEVSTQLAGQLQTDRKKYRQIVRYKDRQIETYIERYRERQIERYRERQIERYKERKIDRMMQRKKNRQNDIKKERYR